MKKALKAEKGIFKSQFENSLEEDQAFAETKHNDYSRKMLEKHEQRSSSPSEDLAKLIEQLL